MIAFVTNLDLVVVRMTGSSGSEYLFEDYLRGACTAVFTKQTAWRLIYETNR